MPFTFKAKFDQTDQIRAGRPYTFIPCVQSLALAEARLKAEGEQRSKVYLKDFGGGGWLLIGYYGAREILMRYQAGTYIQKGPRNGPDVTSTQTEGWCWWFGSMSQHACSGLPTFEKALAHCLAYLENGEYSCNDGVA